MLDFGLVGNCKTCALITRNGIVNYMCFPDFDSPTVFAKLLDETKGGSLSIHTQKDFDIKQYYVKNTAVLITEYKADDEAFKIIDFMPKATKNVNIQNMLVRIIKPIKGNPKIRVNSQPKPGYGQKPITKKLETNTYKYTVKQQEIYVKSNASFQFKLENEVFIAIGNKNVKSINVNKANNLLQQTKKYWNEYVQNLYLPQKNKEVIIRSAITLKLLSYDETGAIIAAATTSIPEEIGSQRSWDYRYCWIRDASYAVDALEKIGRSHESKKFITFMKKVTNKGKNIQPLYGIKGEKNLKEHLIQTLDGFKRGPVRKGNEAFTQKQHDVFGTLIDILYLRFEYYANKKEMKPSDWIFLKTLVNKIRDHWQQKDVGIWEFRTLPNHYTYSKLMCYVGVDRAVKLAKFYEKKDLAKKWSTLRDDIKKDIIKKGYDKEEKTFTISYDGKGLDASLLKMTYHEFLPPHNEMLTNTVLKIYDELRNGCLVKRYKVKDDFGHSNSAFTICTFWLIDALYYIGEKEKAKTLYNQILTYRNHLGLFSEDINIKNKYLVGNFPQAYTHIALINSSILLSEWNSKRKKIKDTKKE